MRIKMLLFGSILGLVSMSGCTTIPNSHMKSNEKVVITVVKSDTRDLNIAKLAVDTAKRAGKIVLKEVAKRYESDWGGQITGQKVVESTPDGRRSLDAYIFVDRYVENNLLACRVVYQAQTIEGTQGSYFSITPQEVQVYATAAKLTGFLSSWLHADKLKLSADLDITFANSNLPGGTNTVSVALECDEVAPGTIIRPDQNKYLRVFEIDGDAPVQIHFTANEQNKMSKLLRKAADSIK